MLNKLLKYEFRSTAIYFLPIYAALILVSSFFYIVNKISETIQGDIYMKFYHTLDILEAMSASIYVLLAIGLAVTTFIVIVIRFYKNLLGNEGYLMFTLPVSVEENILAKLIPSIVWFLGSCVLGIFTIISAFFGGFNSFFGFIDIYPRDLGIETVSQYITIFALLILGVIASLATIFLFYYLCMCIGQMFNSHKFIASAITFLILRSVFQVLGIVLMFSSFDTAIIYLISDMFDNLNPFNAAVLFFTLYDVTSFIEAAILFFIDSLILKKKLNLT